jgi:predicted nucleotidyltransferase
MTKDIDILIRSESLEAAKVALADIEYDLESGLFRFNPKTDQESQMYRVSRAEGNDLVTLDLMLVAPVFESVGNDRETVSLGEIMIKVVSNKGLITMKRVAARPRDIADIAVLQRLDDEQ